MAIRNIRLEGDEILYKKSREVDSIDDRIQILIDDMIETMHKFNGVGLAAVQVGILKRVIVIDLYDENGPIALINPRILKTKGEQEGKKKKLKAKELLAQAICHEVDHLEGEVFVNKVLPGTLEYVEPEEKGKTE